MAAMQAATAVAAAVAALAAMAHHHGRGERRGWPTIEIGCTVSAREGSKRCGRGEDELHARPSRTLSVEVDLLSEAVHALKQRKEGTCNFSAGLPYGTTR